MLKKLSFIFIFATHLAHAETCPTPNDIKNHRFYGWQPLNINSGEPLSSSKLEKFQQKVQRFAFAGWLEDAPEGSGECFYYGSQPSIDYLGVYLAKQTQHPDQSTGFWRQHSSYFMRCDADIEVCRFKD